MKYDADAEAAREQALRREAKFLMDWAEEHDVDAGALEATARHKRSLAKVQWEEAAALTTEADQLKRVREIVASAPVENAGS